jgi:hypothetical protein
VRGLDHLDPSGHRQVLAARQAGPYSVVEDARRGTGNRAESRLSGSRQELVKRHPTTGCPVEQFRGAERMQVDLWHGRFDGGDQIQVVVIGVGGQQSLHADLGGAEFTRLGHERGQPLARPRVGAGHGGRVEIPVHDVSECVAHCLLAQRVGKFAQVLQLPTVRAEQRLITFVGQGCRIRGRRTQPFADPIG